jgi:hypothetical protein
LPGAFATAVQAATANWFEGPTTKESKVYFGLMVSGRAEGGCESGWLAEIDGDPRHCSNRARGRRRRRCRGARARRT